MIRRIQEKKDSGAKNKPMDAYGNESAAAKNTVEEDTEKKVDVFEGKGGMSGNGGCGEKKKRVIGAGKHSVAQKKNDSGRCR